MTDALQARMDKESRNGTFEVIPDHPAYGYECCPMCGGQVDRGGDCVGVDDRGDACEAIATLTRWALHDLVLLRVVAYRVHTPGMTVRELAGALGMGKSQADYHLRRAAVLMPRLKTLLQQTKPGVLAQRKRRTKERNT